MCFNEYIIACPNIQPMRRAVRLLPSHRKREFTRLLAMSPRFHRRLPHTTAQSLRHYGHPNTIKAGRNINSTIMNCHPQSAQRRWTTIANCIRLGQPGHTIHSRIEKRIGTEISAWTGRIALWMFFGTFVAYYWMCSNLQFNSYLMLSHPTAPDRVPFLTQRPVAVSSVEKDIISDVVSTINFHRWTRLLSIMQILCWCTCTNVCTMSRCE